tara:strand:- start:330 stop:1091 length:762 start_codon:yes stop_codon:yes gene_type:complete
MMIKDFHKMNLPSNLLEGKTILISGSGSGIGRQIAKTFSEFGADLILLSKNLEKLETLYDELNQKYSNNIIIQPLDLEKAEEIDYEKIIRAIEDEYHKIDGLVNNAAILGEKKPLEQYSYSSWKNVLKVNLDASFLLTKNLMPLLKKSDKSSIIFTSSGVGRKGRAYWGAYSISKFATEAMTQILSEELQNTSNVRVNCINPGAVRTKMRESAYPAEKPEKNPLPIEIIKPYLYLISDMSLKINGQSIDAQEH